MLYLFYPLIHHEYLITAQMSIKAVAKVACVATDVIAPIADEDVCHPFKRKVDAFFVD
ncbi:hypothetical protein SAMN05421882_103417 [Nitrosomonas communis]|uniref:Uncharacterized protein n=1 Tax=Nitrosomonas communis TaxID=44574 RepID=A0A1H2X3H8_9PROT|nr:hypothetical protein SAMN05421882_103417 [Nitrosomonas communis]